MKIRHDVGVPKRERGEVATAIDEFVKSSHDNMKLECEDGTEAKRVYNAALYTVRVRELPVKVMKSTNDIYVVKEGESNEV